MIVSNKKGLKLEINPRRWWNLIDWYETICFAMDFKNSNITFRTADWRFTYGSYK